MYSATRMEIRFLKACVNVDRLDTYQHNANITDNMHVHLLQGDLW